MNVPVGHFCCKIVSIEFRRTNNASVRHFGCTTATQIPAMRAVSVELLRERSEYARHSGLFLESNAAGYSIGMKSAMV